MVAQLGFHVEYWILDMTECRKLVKVTLLVPAMEAVCFRAKCEVAEKIMVLPFIVATPRERYVLQIFASNSSRRTECQVLSRW
jgi:hypothetical protein